MSDPAPQHAFDPTALRAMLFKNNDQVAKVAYSVEETIAAFGTDVSPSTVWRLVRRDEIPTRNTGKRYLVSGGVIIDILGHRPDSINDPRELIEPERRYTIAHLAALLGVPYQIAHRLTGRANIGLTPTRIGTGLYVPGGTILKYLAGHDEPIRYRDSKR